MGMLRAYSPIQSGIARRSGGVGGRMNNSVAYMMHRIGKVPCWMLLVGGEQRAVRRSAGEWGEAVLQRWDLEQQG